VLIAAASLGSAGASAADMTLDVGGTAIRMPVPAGFHDTSRFPGMHKLAERLTPPGNRVLAIFVDETDAALLAKGATPEMRRYMLVQTEQRFEKGRISSAQFSKVADTVRQKHATLLEAAKGKMESVFTDASGKLSKDAGAAIDLKLVEQVPKGIFVDKPDMIGMANLMSYQVSIAGKPTQRLAAGGTTIVRASDKLLFTYVYGEHRDAKDLEWVTMTSSQWADQIVRANPSTPGESKPAARTPGVFDRDRVVAIAIVAAIALGLLAFLWVFVQKARNARRKHDGRA
jgi:hypothetical protein